MKTFIQYKIKDEKEKEESSLCFYWFRYFFYLNENKNGGRVKMQEFWK
jgi:hypothetical protein